MGRYLLVTLKDNLAAEGTTHNVAMLGIQYVPGVLDVVDLSGISKATLETFLMPEHEWFAAPKKAPKKPRR